LYARNHFNGFRVFDDGSCRLQLNHKTHVGAEPRCNIEDQFELAFEVISMKPGDVAGSQIDACGGARPISLAEELRSSSNFPRQKELGAARDPRTILQHQYLFRNGEQVDRFRAWSQLADFQAALFPVLKTFQRFPMTFWILPIPFDTQGKASDWQIRLECCSLFLTLIKDNKLVQLEALLLTFYWPEIQRNTGLLDIVNTSSIALSRRDRVKRLVSAWLLLHVLSMPIPDDKGYLIPKPMPRCLFYRYVRVYRVLQTFLSQDRPKKRYVARLADVCGGSDAPQSAVVSCVLACTGEEVCQLDVTESCTILDLKQRIAAVLRHLPFAVTLLLDGRALPLGAVWAVIGFPPPPLLHVVLIPRTNDYKLDLSNAIQQQEHDAIIKILSAGQDPDCSGVVHHTRRKERVLLTAASAGFFYSVHLLLSALADPSTVGHDSRSALHIAVLKDSPMTLRLLLNSKADVHVQDFGGETPLHYAAVCEKPQLAQQLLQAGADPLDWRGQAPLVCSKEADTRACLMDGCWDRLSFTAVFLLNKDIFATYEMCDQLAQLCRNLQHCVPQDALGGSSNQNALFQIQANKEAARARKMRRIVTWTAGGMELAVRGDAADALVPLNYKHFVACQDIETLAWLNPHSRDRHVRFEQKDHVYFVHGLRTHGSVTGMIHAFARAFDADAVIRKMIHSDRWPRPNYLRPVLSEASLQRVRQVDPELVLALLDVPRNDPWICCRIQTLREHHPDLCDSLALSPEEIKKMWGTNALEAAACGTYMHHLFEAYLNGYAVPQFSPEIAMLQTFLQGMPGWRAYRTEWVIFGEDENLAGSIDFCAKDEKGTLALIDWKRSGALETKYSSPCSMLPPLAHLPDCAETHYRLQLNAYRYIIEKYYGHTVAKMLVVGTHPDRQLEPFVDDVPRLEQETEAVMHIWRMKAKDARGAGLEHAQLTVCSAVNAEPLLECALSIFAARNDSLLHTVRIAVSNACGVPRFGVQVLREAGLLDDWESWEECGCPDSVFVVKKPFSLAWTEDLFMAIENKQTSEIYEVLQRGQDPNCVLQESALTHAVVQGNVCAVQILLRAGAVPDFIPVGQHHAAIHMAAIADSPACLEMLLRSQAEPNLPDLRGMLPIHHAMCVETAGQVEAVDILLEWGADVLQRDYDGESAFSLASPGSCVAACMDQCWKQLTMLDIVHRQSEDLVGYLMGSGCLRELRQTCWVLRKCFEFRGLSAEYVIGGCSNMSQEILATVDASTEQQPRVVLHPSNGLMKQNLRTGLPRFEQDRCGGASQEEDFNARIEQEVQHLDEVNGVDRSSPRVAGEARRAEPAAEQQVKEEADAEDPRCDDEDDPLLASVKRRRLMKGASTTRHEFDQMFRNYDEWNQALASEIPDVAKGNDTILSRVKTLRQQVRTRFPTWSDYLICLGAAALAANVARLTDRLFVGDNAFFLWLVEGDRHIRVHDGFCYIYNDDGAFLPYSGTPPQAVLLRLSLFFGHLEGIFRRMSPTARRNDVDILSSIAADRAKFSEEDSFLQACNEAAIWQQTLAPAHQADDDDDDGVDLAAEVQMQDNQNKKARDEWTIALGKRVWKICQSIRSDLMHEKLVSLLVEWCETPRSQKQCVAYEDTFVQYDVSRETILKHLPKSSDHDCYIYIPHPLLDPTLEQHKQRLHKFYQQTFWANNDVFACNMAAMALAKRGFNVDRCFIGESPGGVGQSLFSMHIDAMLGSNHGYFDPNVWYNEDELRKQVESFARCIVVSSYRAGGAGIA